MSNSYYRNAVYIAFAADGETDPTKSDIKYYNLLKARKELENTEFSFVNAHEKANACRDSSKDETIKSSLRKRLKSSKSMLLFVGKTTKFDDDFVPYEICYAVDNCTLPIIVCYVNYRDRIVDSIPNSLKNLWPDALKDRIENDKVRTIHIPFKEAVIHQAIIEFSVNNPPSYAAGIYKSSVYDKLL